MKERKIPIDPKILKEVEQHLRIQPGYPDFQNQLGLLRVKEGKMEEAEAHFQGALQRNPNYPEALLNLGCLYMENERWHEAEGLLRFGSQRHPRNAFFMHLLAVLYLMLGKPPKAASHIQRAIRLRPFYRGYYRKSGVWRRGRGRYFR